MSMEFRDIEGYRDAFPNFPHQFFRTYEKPKYYDYIPESYKLKWEDPHKFLPDRMVNQFNQRIFLNFVHRECFNSCVQGTAALSEAESNCYNNCKSKHLSSLGTFKEILQERRQWKGWKNFLNVQEYSRTPEEIATNYPTDPMLRSKLVDDQEKEFMKKQTMGLREALNSEFAKDEKATIFDVYMNGKYTHDSRVGKERKAALREDFYNEYKELNQKYGAQVAEMLRVKVNTKDWKDVPGDDWVPDEEPAAEVGEIGESTPEPIADAPEAESEQ